MKKNLFISMLIAFACIAFTSSCSDDDENNVPSPTEKVLTILDVDPGTDDSYCLFLASKVMKDVEPDYCVATFGNKTAPDTRRNAAVMIKYLGMKSQLVLGAEKPFNGIEPSCGDFHGTDGIAGLQSTLMTRFKVTDADIAKCPSLADLKAAIKAADKVRYVAVGPLTSLAMLIEDAEVEKKIEGVYIMGGGIKVCNYPHNGVYDSEYNFAGDGDAVVKVFNSNLKLSLVPLDFTHEKYITPENIADFAAIGTYPEMITIVEQNKTSNMTGTPPTPGAVIHDMFPLIYLHDKSAFTTKEMKLSAISTGHIEEAANGRSVTVITDIANGYHINLIKQAFLSGK